MFLAKVLDGRLHVIHPVEFREAEPGEHFHRWLFRSSRATNEQRLTCHIFDIPGLIRSPRLRAALVRRQAALQRVELPVSSYQLAAA